MVIIDDLIRQRARAAIEIVAQKAHVRAAYLFGSQVLGKADKWSDIDIAAFIENAEKWNLSDRVDMAVEAQRKVGDDIELHFFPAESLRNPPIASFAGEILRHGVCIWENGS